MRTGWQSGHRRGLPWGHFVVITLFGTTVATAMHLDGSLLRAPSTGVAPAPMANADRR